MDSVRYSKLLARYPDVVLNGVEPFEFDKFLELGHEGDCICRHVHFIDVGVENHLTGE